MTTKMKNKIKNTLFVTLANIIACVISVVITGGELNITSSPWLMAVIILVDMLGYAVLDYIDRDNTVSNKENSNGNETS